MVLYYDTFPNHCHAMFRMNQEPPPAEILDQIHREVRAQALLAKATKATRPEEEGEGEENNVAGRRRRNEVSEESRAANAAYLRRLFFGHKTP